MNVELSTSAARSGQDLPHFSRNRIGSMCHGRSVPQATGYFQLLLDESFPILPTIVKVDATNQFGRTSALETLEGKLWNHRQKLDIWHHWLEIEVPGPLFTVKPSTWGTGVSIPCFPTTVDFKSFLIAVAFACFCIFSVVVEQIIAEIHWRLL